LARARFYTAWPQSGPQLDTGSQRLAQSITAISDGRLKVTVYPANTLVRALETFDAVGASVADMYHSFDLYFESKSPALYFFAQCRLV
jgi:TRAP-type mannitol/chloroaromatic compound transport system substrate-binding protein